MHRHAWLVALVLLACSSEDAATSSSGDPPTGPPDGGGSGDAGGPPPAGAGIAARYPGDVGIESDPDVVFADGFEGYGQASDLSQKWSNFFQTNRTRIATEPANVRAGAKSLEFTLPMQTNELSNAVQKVLSPELDVLFLRFYSKLAGTFDVTGSSHNGGGISAHYFMGNNATPGVPANGTNKFLMEFECWRGMDTDTSPGALNLYIYHPEQRSNYGDHFFPTGTVLPNSSMKRDWGAGFVARTDITPELDRWYAYEMMVKANTPGQSDGRVTLWLDGEVYADFPNLRLRDVGTLTIDRFNLSLHAGSNPTRETKKWYDNVVAAKKYIGPLRAP
jgi:hypothetical protein